MDPTTIGEESTAVMPSGDAARLTVLNVAFPLAPVGPDAVGGAEQVVSRLDAALVDAGHCSLVVAVEGSSVRGTHLAIPAPPERVDHAAWIRAHDAQRAAIARAAAEWPIDVVHLHGVDFDCYLPPPGPPALVTLHLPFESYRPGALRVVRPLTFLHCVSASQRERFPREVPLIADVTNGVDLDELWPSRRRRRYALALGRICAQKGADLALEAAARAGVPLVLAGAVQPFPEHVAWFEREVRPRLGAGAWFVGPVAGPRKRRLVAGAACVVVASRVPETCSLVALEALACGTPVVAFRRGELPAIVEHGRTGFLVDGVDELAFAIREAGALPSRACREAAEARFSAAETTARYLDLYRRLAAIRPRARAAPRSRPPGPRAELRVEEVTTLARLEALAARWGELWERSVAATPFTSPAWLLPWCRHLAQHAPWSIAVWRGAELAALAPTFVYPSPRGPVLGLLGGGPSDYQDVVADGRDATAAVLDHLARRGARFARAELEALPPASALLGVKLPEGWRATVTPQDVCPVLPLDPGGDVLARRASPKLLDDLRYRRRRLAREGEVDVVRATRDTLPSILAELFRLHRARWRSREAPGVLAAPRLARFHADAAPALLDGGLLRLYALRVSGRTVGVLHGFHALGRAYAYLSGIDPAAAHASPGSILFAHAIEEAVREGAIELDFLRGNEAYKYRWGAVDRPTLRLALEPAEAARPARPPGAGAGAVG